MTCKWAETTRKSVGTVGILTETPGLYDRLSAEKNLRIFARLYEVKDVPGQVEKYLRMLGLWDRRDDLAGNFSKGMKQKLAICRALLHEPKVLFLDEPTSGLDPEAAKLVHDFIAELKSEGRTIFMCTHNLDEADRLCDRGRRDETAAAGGGYAPESAPATVWAQGGVSRETMPERGWSSRSGRCRSPAKCRPWTTRSSSGWTTPKTQNPVIVRKLVEAGADVQFVGELRHSLEEVYLSLIDASLQGHRVPESGNWDNRGDNAVNKILTIIDKEWAEVFKNRVVLFTVLFMPLFFTALPLVVLYAMRASPGNSDVMDMPPQFTRICGNLTGAACTQYFIVNQFMLLFMMMPLAIPVAISAYSIVGEKTTRCLEPLLATPITTIELIVGKGLAAAIPAIARDLGGLWHLCRRRQVPGGQSRRVCPHPRPDVADGRDRRRAADGGGGGRHEHHRLVARERPAHRRANLDGRHRAAVGGVFWADGRVVPARHAFYPRHGSRACPRGCRTGVSERGTVPARDDLDQVEVIKCQIPDLISKWLVATLALVIGLAVVRVGRSARWRGTAFAQQGLGVFDGRTDSGLDESVRRRAEGHRLGAVRAGRPGNRYGDPAAVSDPVQHRPVPARLAQVQRHRADIE